MMLKLSKLTTLSIGILIASTGIAASNLQQAYMQSVSKTALHEVKPVRLLTIPKSQKYVEMTTWTNENIPYGPFKMDQDTWVTISKQMRSSCSRFPAKQVNEKIEEFLGMPPMKSYKGWHLVTMLVPNKQADMRKSKEGLGIFRPCYSTDSIRVNKCGFNADSKAGSYNAWVINLMADEFTTTDPYPWSGLGYTYNWDPKAKSVVGGSEFLVTKGTPVEIVKSESANEFCQ